MLLKKLQLLALTLLVPIIFNEFIYKVSPIEIPTIPLIIKTNIEKTSENQLIVRTTGKKKIEARTFLEILICLGSKFSVSLRQIEQAKVQEKTADIAAKKPIIFYDFVKYA